MSMKAHSYFSLFLAIVAVAILMSPRVEAATLIWDNDSLTSLAQDGGGDWTLGGLTFWDGISTNIATTNDITTDIAQFGNGGTLGSVATVNVSTQSINGLIFGATTTSGYTLTASSSGQALTIGSSGIVLSSGAQATTLGGANLGITLGAAQSWTNNSASLFTVVGDVTNGTNLLTIGGTGNTTISGVIGNGSGGLTKSGAGTLTLTGQNTYTGTTTIGGGILSLSGGNDRLATSGTVNFSASSTLSITGSQTLSNVTVANSVTGTINGGGSLTLNGSSFAIGGTSGSNSQTLNLSGLSSFFYNNSSGSFTVSGTSASSTGKGFVTLPGTATITASSFGIGSVGPGSGSGPVTGSLTLGATTTINAGTITLGASRATGTIQYSSATNPTLTLRGSDGSSAVTTMSIGDSGAASNPGTFSSLVDLTTGVSGTSTIDALVTTLTIGKWSRNTTNAIITTGELRMGGGTLTANTINLGVVSNTSNGGNTTGSLTVSGGTVRVTDLVLGSQTGIAPVSGVFNLNSSANLYAQNIKPGANSATRTFNWNEGTIYNLNGSTDLTINSFGGTATFVLNGASASHVFDIDSGRLGTINQAISGAGALTKVDGGTLILNGNNTFTGGLTINAGTVRLGSAGALNSTAGLENAVEFGASSTGTLALNGNSVVIANLTTNATPGTTFVQNANGSSVSNATLTVGNSTNASGTFAGTIQDGTGGGTLALTKAGSGNLTLTGTNTYTGATNINGGSLIINGSTSASSVVTVATSGTLGGSGTVGGATTVNGTLRPGNSPGGLSFGDILTLTSTATTVMEIDGNAGAGVISGHDFVNLTGSGAQGVLTYGGTLTLDFGSLFGVGSYSWNLFDFASESETFTTIALADQYTGSLLDGDTDGIWDLTSGNNTWIFTESTGVLGLTVIPEPKTALLGAFGILLLLRRRRD
jgi:autotransporter-associated beta strand protein